jgi:starch synthase
MVGLPDQAFLSGGVEFYGKVSYMKAGIARADAVTTVSPTYSKEIQTPAAGWGLDGLLRARKDVLHGILNGADYSLWDPAVDPYLAANYSAANLAGKALCKRDLLETVGLDATALENAPVVGIVARLSEQKGFDLVGAAADALMAEGIVLVVLGSGEARYVDLFRGLADRYPGRVAFRVGYNEALAHKIEAGADLFLMPSLYEPCGLNQIYSLRYGTVPVVRAVGGLDDTVTTETGFKFADYSGQALLESVREAVRAYRDKRNWKRRVLAGMAMDYSWTASAHQYAELYRRLRN